MSNYFLLKSTYISLCIHLFFFILYYNNSKNILIILYSIGLLTSLLNHANTNVILMYLDRFTMYICFAYNLILFVKTNNSLALYLMLFASILYFLQKKYNNSSKHYFHFVSHVSIALCNVILYVNY